MGTFYFYHVTERFVNFSSLTLFKLFFFVLFFFPGRWEVRWWWTPTAFAGRRSVWRGSRLSCARLSRRSSARWPKGPDWASGSASTSSGTAGGTAPATTSTLAKYCSKVSERGMDVFLHLLKHFGKKLILVYRQFDVKFGTTLLSFSSLGSYISLA